MNKDLLLVWLTKWEPGYGGGGETTFLDQMKWGLEHLPISIIWICFEDVRKKRYFDKFSIKYIGTKGRIVHIPGGFSRESLACWLKLIKPDLVHHQGHLKQECYEVCHSLRIPFLSSYHFWLGAVNLNPNFGNKEILLNLNHHTIENKLISRLKNSHDYTMYVCSKFMRDVIWEVSQQSIDIKNIIYPIPDPKRCISNQSNFLHLNKNKVLTANKHFEYTGIKFVTLLNIHYLKGGKLFLDLIKTLQNIPFWAIQTESGSESLDEEIKNTIISRNKKMASNINVAECRYSNFIDNVKEIYSQTKIVLVPSLVDETFCRVILESFMNAIPVITSGKGNIINLVDEKSAIVIKNNINDLESNSEIYNSYLSQWQEAVKTLYFDEAKYLLYSEGARKRLESFPSFDESCNSVFNLIYSCIEKFKDKKNEHVMIFAPFGTQGLGIQTLNYINLLESKGIKSCVFSPHSYWTVKSGDKYQKDKSEWQHSRVYYSPNNRENITDLEILSFIEVYKVTRCLIPETCWFRVFQIAALLESRGVECIAIPNIETVRKDEIFKHKVFSKIFCNNELCYNVFKKYNFPSKKLFLTKYSIPSKFKKKKISNQEQSIKFLALGGNNAFSRKRIDKILMAFSQALQQRQHEIDQNKTTNNNDIPPYISLTVTMQLCTDEEHEQFLEKFTDIPEITIIRDILTNREVTQLYHTHHVIIQCSEQEGLGLGFYEALSTGTPCITIDISPHNEIIKSGVSGIIIPCTLHPLELNPDGVIKKGVFKTEDLTQAILEISKSKKNLKKLFHSTKKHYYEIADYNKFSNLFIKSIFI